MTIILDFYADWCNPCKQMEPVLKAVEKELDPKTVVLRRINIDTDSETTQNCGVQSIPTIVVEKEGKETGRIVGVTTKKKILELL